MTTVPAPPTVFDPAAPVPEEYDVFCHGCGYSLVGLAADRCPECGKPYNPGELPYARVAWLHRRRIGRWKAYWRTVRHVVFRPRSFAAELCRPVRISADDAKRFRRLTIYLAVTASLAVVLVLAGMAEVPLTGRWYEVALAAIQLAGAWLAAVIFLRLATDMPLFIWQGLPSLPPSELAPLHHYAAAPLALTPAMVAVAGLAALPVASFALTPLVILLAVGAWLYACWATPLVLMKAATGCGNRRVVSLAVYLPLHWLLMVAAVGMSLIVVVIGGVEGLQWLWPWIQRLL